MPLTTSSLSLWSNSTLLGLQTGSVLTGVAAALVTVAALRLVGRCSYGSSSAADAATAPAPGAGPLPRPGATDPCSATPSGAELALAGGDQFACRFRADTTLTWVNPAYCELWGRSADELIGTRWIEHVDAAARERAERAIAALGRHATTTRDEQRVATFDGDVCVLWVHHALVDAAGEVDEIFSIGTDVTALERTIDQLGRSEAQLGFALEAADLGLWDMDVESEGIERNASWHALVDRPIGSVESTLDGWRQVVHPDDVERTEAVMAEHFAGASRQWCMQYRLRHGDGHWIWVEDRGRVVERWPDGRARRAMGVVQDVTSRRSDAVELERTRAVAEHANEAKGRFLANMSHEIRTPLTAVLGYAELARDESLIRGEQRIERLRGHLDVVLRNGRHLSQLLDEILDLTKIEAGEMRIDLGPVQVRDILDEVVEMLGGTARERGLELTLEIDGGAPHTIRTDGLRVRQILVNLVGNAIKFTESGSVTVRARSVFGADRVLDRDLPGELHVDVVDRAGGIDEATLRAIFEPFVQGEASVARRFGGTGLGLTISQHLAQLIGGEVRAASRPGDGSTFSICLPLDVDDVVRIARDLDRAPAALPRPKPARADGSGGRVLLAEDGEDNRRLVGLVLERAGCRVEAVENGRLAIDAVLRAQAEGRPFDLVLMDMQMPVLDGYAATRELRASGVTLPIVALTANAFADERARCLESGCDDHTTKPIRKEAFIACIERWIGIGRERAATST